jgi:prolyl-tRNA synthetase
MGSYGIGMERLLAAIIEENHDENGIVWPRELAPFDVHVVAIQYEQAEVREAADRLVSELEGAGLRVLVDDREESPGVKFKDADLLGMPVRATVSPRNLEQGAVEVRMRTGTAQTGGHAPENELVALGEAAVGIRERLAAG